MAAHLTRRILPLSIGVALLVALAFGLALRVAPTHAQSQASSSSTQSQATCIGHHPQEYVWYTRSCTGHDEPELDPVSNHPGSARDITWTVVLPTDGTTAVDSVGPTFWIGGTVTDPNSLFGQAFLEAQFYPNSLLKGCTAGGGFNVTYAPGDYTVCSPVWKVSQHGYAESAAFNAMLTDSATGGPLVMHAGDTITDHQYVTAAQDGMHITVTDLNTGHSGTIILNSPTDGPLMPAFDTQTIGNALKWGLVYDTPNSLVWEIGHTSPYTQPASQFCLPGSATKPPCYSYNLPSWDGFSPLQVKDVTFGDGSNPQNWAAVSDYGGEAEVNQYCGAANYSQPFCVYPWFAYNASAKTFTYGGDYPGTTRDFGQALQFAQTTQCPSPFGPNTTYCDTILR
ncbi:MAG: hypothetical protein ACM3N4_07365 [Nitrososphaerota archaeon]